jgi:hypothetical protein
LNEDQRDDCSCNDEAFEGGAAHGWGGYQVTVDPKR